MIKVVKITQLTHKGWLGLCPVYIGDLCSECPLLVPRLPLTDWLLSLSACVFDLLGAEGCPIRVSGLLAEPIDHVDEDGGDDAHR